MEEKITYYEVYSGVLPSIMKREISTGDNRYVQHDEKTVEVKEYFVFETTREKFFREFDDAKNFLILGLQNKIDRLKLEIEETRNIIEKVRNAKDS